MYLYFRLGLQLDVVISCIAQLFWLWPLGTLLGWSLCSFRLFDHFLTSLPKKNTLQNHLVLSGPDLESTASMSPSSCCWNGI